MNRMDPRAKRTRKMIIDAFASLVQTKSAEAISIKELVAAAGLSRATFYLHFEDMPSFLKELTDEIMQSLVNHVSNDGSNTISVNSSRHYYKRYFDFILENQMLFRGMLGIHGYPPFRQKFIEAGIKAYSAQLLPHREIIEEYVSVDMLTYYIVFAHTGIVEHWLNEDCKYSPQYMAKQIELLTVEGLKPIAQLKDVLVLPQ